MNKNKFFTLDYIDSKGENKKYICRFGVLVWNEKDGTQKFVQGTGQPTPETHIRLYAANRKGYRMFKLSNILSIIQNGINYSIKDLISQ